MSPAAKVMCGIILITLPTIEFGGYFVLQILSGQVEGPPLTDFQQAMFRAGHGHAGVLVILSLIAQFLADHARLNNLGEWVVRLGFPTAALLVSGGFFGAAIGEGVTEPQALIGLLYGGVVLLAAVLILLGVGLIRNRKTI